jgi:3-oxoacyl-[acyl-carrier-protein] synthase III
MRFLSIEHVLPSRRVTNQEVVERVRAESAQYLSARDLDTLEQLIHGCLESAGTQVRYYRDEQETAVDLAVRAGQQALAGSGLAPQDIDLLLYVGIGRGVLEPASGSIYQDLLGLGNATAFDVLDACASWVRALHMAKLYLATGTYRNIMILNAEFAAGHAQRYALRTVGEFAHWHPSITIGEAATATIVAASDEPIEFDCDFRTWGQRRDLCFVPLDNFEGYFGKQVEVEGGFAPMQFVSFGMRLMEFGARKLIEHYRDSPRFADFKPDLVFGHSASDGMSEHVLDSIGIERDKFSFGHTRYANTVSASVPLTMSEAIRAGTLRDGDRVLVLVASAGVTTALTKFVYRG